MAKNSTATQAAEIVADICLYGGTNGAGYLARTTAGKMIGTGDPVANRSLTDAVWLAVIELHELGLTRGSVRVFEPSGRRMAIMSVSLPCYFGELVWTPAPVYTISAAALEAAASKN